jgi:predicted PurR-regulated permease PerM
MQRTRALGSPSPRAVVAIGAALLLLAVLYLGRGALGPFIIGALLVYVLDPAVGWLTRRRTPRWLAILIVYAVAILVLVEGLSLLFGPLVRQVVEFVDDLPRILQQVQSRLNALAAVYDQLQLPRVLRDVVDDTIAALASAGPGSAIDPGAILPIAKGIVAFLGSLLGLAIVPVWAFYLLKDRDRLLVGLGAGIPAEWRADAWALLAIVERVFRRWLRGQLLLCLAVGLATFAGLLLLSAFVDPLFGRFAVLLAVIAGVLELLPIIGPIISMVPTVLLAATTGRLELIVAVVLLYLVVQQLENNLLVPKIQGDAIEMHPAVVILALTVGAAIAGFLGAIFALPIAAAARDVYRYVFQRASGAAPSEARGYRPPPASAVPVLMAELSAAALSAAPPLPAPPAEA